MTEQQPQEPYGDPQYESYREGTPTEPSPVVPSSVMPTSPIPASSMSQPTESVPTISMPTESIPATGASGPTGASRQRQAPQPHTPYGFSSATRLPHPGRMRLALSRLLKPVRHSSYEAPGPWSRTPNGASSSASSPFTTGQTNRQAHPPYQRTRCRHTSSTARCSPRGKRASGGRHHGDSRRRNRHTRAAVHRRDRRLMTVAKNHISQAPTSRPTATATRLPPTRIRPTPSRPPPSTAWTSGPDTRAW